MNYKKLYTLPLLLSLMSSFTFAAGEAEANFRGKAPSNVKAWRIKEHSLKIAFKDNTVGETGFDIDIIDENGNNVIAPVKLKASEGTGKFLIGKIDGLDAGGEYFAVVTAYNTSAPQGSNFFESERLRFKLKGGEAIPFEGEAPSNLKAWRVKEHTAKISFKDNTIGEAGFTIDIVDENGNFVTTPTTLKSGLGIGSSLLGKVTGLDAGTEYFAVVTAYKDLENQGQNSIESEYLRFKTRGGSTTPPENGVVATDLKTWGVKQTSAMISFKNHLLSEKDVHFIFTNVDTWEEMTLNSKGVIPVPNNEAYSIGKMLNLTPNTTYRVRITARNSDGTTLAKASEPITFTTKK